MDRGCFQAITRFGNLADHGRFLPYRNVRRAESCDAETRDWGAWFDASQAAFQGPSMVLLTRLEVWNSFYMMFTQRARKPTRDLF